ncbi:MAG: hypothetical protein OEW58_06705, partial [Gammaproteobacteria bacterium]|nr:hypothetical protein [Gammaproteobacteria bacterium]
MFLKKFIYVNWGNIPNMEFDMGPVNLLSGGNGSGKTTAADAIQTIMTAAHENLFQFNPGQDETTQRGRGGKKVRTLSSYVLGCDDGSFARVDTTDGYLAGVFHPTEGESASPFTAVICIRAWLDQAGGLNMARQDELFFLILPEEQLSLADFVREDIGGKYVTPIDRLPKLLIKQYGNAHVEKYDTKKAYLRRLYAMLRGRDDAVSENEAVAAARAFSRFMAYKPVQSINNFVAEEILERKNLDEVIHSISSQLKTIHAMERDAARLVGSIDLLQQTRHHSQTYIEQWIAQNTLDYTLAQHQHRQRQQQYTTSKQAQRDLMRAMQENKQQLQHIGEQRELARQQLVELEAKRLGVRVLQEKDQLEKQQQDLQKQLISLAQQLLQEDNTWQQQLQLVRSTDNALNNSDLLTELTSLDAGKTRSLSKQLLQDARQSLDFRSLVNRDWTGDLRALDQLHIQAQQLQQLHHQWSSLWTDSVLAQLQRVAQRNEQQLEQLKPQLARKQHEVERLQDHKVSYPAYVERAITAIRQQCPKADPRVLCDHVEISEPHWQAAIEGYLGNARFSIIVAAEYEAEATRIVRNMSGRDNRARIIQGQTAQSDAQRIKLDSNSIIHIMEFSHATARHYLTASYGSVQRVDNTEELRQTRRGITADGVGSGNYSMWRCDIDDSELVFGAAARQRALLAKQTELANLNRQFQLTSAEAQQSSDLLKSVQSLRELRFSDLISDMLGVHKQTQQLETRLSHLDLTEFSDMERQLDLLRDTEKAFRAQENQLNIHEGELQSDLKKLTDTCKQLSQLQDSTEQAVEKCAENLRAIAKVWTDFDVQHHLDQAELEIDSINASIAEKQREDISKQLRSSERRMNDLLQQHNEHCRPVDRIFYQGLDANYDSQLFSRICDLQKDIDRVYNMLRNNILVEKHHKLKELKDSFNNAFVTNLCHSIYQSISDGQRQIEMLNKELQHHRFGADRETFRFDSEWIPEYRTYAKFFEDVIKNPTLGDEVTLFNAELSKASQKVRDELMAMLLSDDEQKALGELERIADYRNYRRYEIYKEVDGKPPIALSEYGTGSGGQLETPAYIIRAAAITSAFRFSEGNSHLRMVLVDEAFSKMDETRSREVINYLTESLGLQLLFIMPTSKCGP